MPIAHTSKPKPPTKQRDWHDWISSVGIPITFVAAFTAAIFIGKQWVVADRSMRLGYRAYVTSTGFQLINYGQQFNGETNWILSPYIENTGNTSTRFLKTESAIDEGIGPNWAFNWKEKSNHLISHRLAPKASTLGNNTLGPAFFLVPTILERIRNRQMTVIGSGIISYYDIFGNVHYGEFYYAPWLLPTDWQHFPPGQAIKVNSWPVPQCNGHNCEDEECSVDWRERAESMQQ